VAAAIVLVVAVQGIRGPAQAVPSAPRAAPRSVVRDGRGAVPTAPGSYIGLYANGAPDSYAGVTAFAAATGVEPDVVLYYSGWLEPFQASFATSAARNGAVPLVQMDPTGISLATIASGQYDGYLGTYADAVRAYRHPVILSFGHEMNGGWYSWGNGHTSPAVFVAAWRHIVNLFRALGARNVTWMWTVNIIHHPHGVPSPGPWWPGSSYVNWVGIDGYYYSSSQTFAPLFGPTIVAVRSLTRDPILISETGVASAAGQPAKIANLFAGIRLYGLLGFVWFDSIDIEDWRLTSLPAIAAFRRGAATYHGRAS
jgi:mannan endo-1,4-beta-mannosidase